MSDGLAKLIDSIPVGLNERQADEIGALFDRREIEKEQREFERQEWRRLCRGVIWDLARIFVWLAAGAWILRVVLKITGVI